MEQLPLLAPETEPAEAAAVEPLDLAGHRILIGTCGYSYRDWIGPFYPPGTKPAEMLGRYTRRFPAVEIDSTYYRIPSLATFASMDRRSPTGFRFTAKAPSTLTHVSLETRPALDDAAIFREALAPLVASGKLGAVLLQFPNAFRPGTPADAHLRRLRDEFEDLPLVAEFRHRAWQTGATLTLLDELGIGWCNVDEPRFEGLVRPSSDVVGDTAYVRFHGRNAKMWWKGDAAERYDYSYSTEELEPWMGRVAEMATAASETYVFFNNHRFGQAASDASRFAAMLTGIVEGS